jgi:hypothetical protein
MIYDTLALTSDTWDISFTPSGDLPLATSSTACLQDVLSALLVWRGELYYNSTFGVPYRSFLGSPLPPRGLLQHFLTTVASSVPGVTSASVSWTLTDRSAAVLVSILDELHTTSSLLLQ